MKSLDFGRYAIGGFAAVVLLAGCGAVPLSLSKGQDDMQPPGAVPKRRGRNRGGLAAIQRRAHLTRCCIGFTAEAKADIRPRD